MKKFIFPLVAIGLLAACATPQEKCASDARRNYRAIQSQVEKVRANIVRGYAVHKTREPFTVIGRCVDRNRQYYSCPRTDYRVVEKPVSIDIAEQKIKLRDLEERASVMYDIMNNRVQHCGVLYPS